MVYHKCECGNTRLVNVGGIYLWCRKCYRRYYPTFKTVKNWKTKEYVKQLIFLERSKACGF